MGAFTWPSGDDGSAPARVTDALAERAAGRTGWREVVAALSGGRILVPLLEVGQGELTAEAEPSLPPGARLEEGSGCADGDRAMAAVTVRTDRGTLALGFTGIDALLTWRSEARPMPVDVDRAARAALADGSVGLLLDAGSAHQVLIPPAVLRRIAVKEPWSPAWLDPVVRDRVLAELAPGLAGGMRVRLVEPGPAVGGRRTALRVELGFRERLDGTTTLRRAERVAEVLAADGALAELLDGDLEVAIAPTG